MAKIRTGFVSNSSSSSFIIGVKEPMTVEHLERVLNVPQQSVLSGFVKDLAKYIVEESKQTNIEDELSDYGYESVEEAIKDNSTKVKLLIDGWKVYELRCSYNEADSPFEALIGNNGIDDFESESIIFKNLY